MLWDLPCCIVESVTASWSVFSRYQWRPQVMKIQNDSWHCQMSSGWQNISSIKPIMSSYFLFIFVDRILQKCNCTLCISYCQENNLTSSTNKYSLSDYPKRTFLLYLKTTPFHRNKQRPGYSFIRYLLNWQIKVILLILMLSTWKKKSCSLLECIILKLFSVILAVVKNHFHRNG